MTQVPKVLKITKGLKKVLIKPVGSVLFRTANGFHFAFPISLVMVPVDPIKSTLRLSKFIWKGIVVS